MISITFTLIALTALTSVLAWTVWPQLQEDGMMRPRVIFTDRKWYQLLSSSFLHADVGHLLLNMITLFFFGPPLEQTIGSGLFLILYLTAAVLSSIPSLIRHRNNSNYASLGASGAIEAILFSFIVFYPFERISLFLIPIGIPAVLFGFLFIAYSLWESNRGKGRINHDAHIAGAIWGVIFTFLFIPYSRDHFVTMVVQFLK